MSKDSGNHRPNLPLTLIIRIKNINDQTMPKAIVNFVNLPNFMLKLKLYHHLKGSLISIPVEKKSIP